MGEVEIKVVPEHEVALHESVIAALKASMRGEVIQPGEPEYEQARKVYNAMIDKHPRLIVRCADVADVMTAVDFARTNDLLLAVRCGGHSGAGLGTCDDGIVVDLSRMKGIRIDRDSGMVRVEGGCTQGDVDHAASAFGLAVPTGTVSTTGLGGLTLGGGHGYLTRKYGLTIDNLLAADVVLADGHLVTASAKENADLFWAIRGGGGNFGIITSFLFRARPVSTVYAGPMFWEIERASEVMHWYREYMPAASEDIYGFFMFMNIPPVSPFPGDLHGRNVCGVIWCHLGSPERARSDLDAVRYSHPPLFDGVGLMPFVALQRMFDPLIPPGLQWYWKGDFVKELSSEAIERHIEHGSRLPSPRSTVHLYPIDGKVNRIPRDATAFSYRDAKWSMVIVGIDADPANADRITNWTREYWSAVHPYSAGGAYVNFMMEEGLNRTQAAYRDNYERLANIKTKYDPQNLFRVNWNIKPQGEGRRA